MQSLYVKHKKVGAGKTQLSVNRRKDKWFHKRPQIGTKPDAKGTKLI